MKRFAYAHATHPNWEIAAQLVLAQLQGQLQNTALHGSPSLGLLYCTDHFAAAAQELLATLGAALPEVTDWAGTVGIGIAATNVEYFDEPALAVMLCQLPRDQYRVFSGVAPLGQGYPAGPILMHADPATVDLAELIQEMAQSTTAGEVFGGLTASRQRPVQFALSSDGTISGQGHTSGVFEGGLSGVAFDQRVRMISRVTQGCLPLGSAYEITKAHNNLVLSLDGRPALDVLLGTLELTLSQPEAVLNALRATLVGLSAEPSDEQATPSTDLITPTGHFVDDVRVRHIIGLDPVRGGVALAAPVQAGMRLAFCQRDAQAARADLVRICAEIREELEVQDTPLTIAGRAPGSPAWETAGTGLAGALYISCVGRGGPHFGGDSAELQIIRHALGDVALVGFFAAGEIAHNQVYGYTGVLTVFASD